MKVLTLHASYLTDAINNPAVIVAAARKHLRGIPYDTLIGTGLSGALVLPMLARALRRKFAVVRKQDNTHSDQSIEGCIGERWVFVDDLVASGATLQRVQSEVRQVTATRGHVTTYVGAFLYCRPRFCFPGNENE